MRLLVWLVRAALFFLLFAFALNNQHEAAIRWFFGHEWRAPMVFIVLVAFALGCAFGVARDGAELVAASPRGAHATRRRPTTTRPPTPRSSCCRTLSPEHPPRDGL